MAAYKEGAKWLSSKRKLRKHIISAARSDHRRDCRAAGSPASSLEADLGSVRASQDLYRAEDTARRLIGPAYRRGACPLHLSGLRAERFLPLAPPAWARTSLWNDQGWAVPSEPAASRVQARPEPAQMLAQRSAYKSSQREWLSSACRTERPIRGHVPAAD